MYITNNFSLTVSFTFGINKKKKITKLFSFNDIYVHDIYHLQTSLLELMNLYCKFIANSATFQYFKYYHPNKKEFDDNNFKIDKILSALHLTIVFDELFWRILDQFSPFLYIFYMLKGQ